jgi:hypothetical protein
LHGQLNGVIGELEVQERDLQKPGYMRSLLTIMLEEKEHDLEGLSSQIDGAVEQYLSNLFDVFVHDEKFDELSRV